MEPYRIKVIAEAIFGLLTAGAVEGLAAIRAGDPNVLLDPGVIALAVVAGVTRFVAANAQNLLAALFGPLMGDE